MSDVAETLMKEWEQFKQENDRRLKEIEKTGRADPLTEEKIDKHSKAIGDLEAQIRELETKANRPALVEDPAKVKNAEQHKAFEKFIRQDGLSAKAASITGSDADGGYAIPEDLDRQVGQIERQATPMRQICNVISVGNEMYEKLFNIGGSANGWVGETTARTATNTPQLASTKPVFGEVYANLSTTQRLLDDAMFDVEAWLVGEMGEQMGQVEDVAFISGAGTAGTVPKGILTYTLAATADSSRTFGTIEKMVTAANTGFTADELIAFIHKLKPGYRMSARWLMPTLTVATCRKFKDATSGQYLWQPGLGGGQPSMLLGFPITEDENIPAVAAEANAVIFGDFKKAYTIADVRGLRVVRDPYTSKPNVLFYGTKRVGGGLADSNAIKVLTIKA